MFMGVNETYPAWFAEEMYRCSYLDESRFTIWVPQSERKADYHEKKLIEDSSVFLRKSNGDLFVVDLDLFTDLYTTFRYDAFTNSGIVAFNDDCIEYVECTEGVFVDAYPDWFYEYFTEAINFPHLETIYFKDSKKPCKSANVGPFLDTTEGEVSVTCHCVFLRNKFGEIKGMSYRDFLKHYDVNPKIGG